MRAGNRIGWLLLLLAVGQAVAGVDQRRFKAGYWKVHTKNWITPGPEPVENTRFVCRNPEFDQWMRATVEAVTGRMGCKVVDEKLAGATYTSETHCMQSGSEAATKVKSTMVGDAEESAETVTTFTPPLQGREKSTMLSDQKWVGACPAGVAPGDSVSASGEITHLWKH